VTIIPEVVASFLLIAYARPTGAGLGSRALSEVGLRVLLHPYPHHMHLLVLTRHLGVVWFVLLHFPQGFAEPAERVLGGAGEGFFW